MVAGETTVVDQLVNDGFACIQSVFDSAECSRIITDLEAALATCHDDTVVLRRANGAIFGARNLLTVFPPAAVIWRKQALLDLVVSVLGEQCGLVRGLYFDKPPEGNWSLPWHQDRTIAVRDHSIPSEIFRNRTRKGRVPHVEAPEEILRSMLTLRIHLDEVTEENGALQVLPGSHELDAGSSARGQVAIFASAGDVLAMRPLLSHSSGVSNPGTNRHRRVIHLEFAAHRELSDGYQWFEFLPL